MLKFNLYLGIGVTSTSIDRLVTEALIPCSW